MPIRVFITKWFARFVRKEGIGSDQLLTAIAEAERGQHDGDLVGGLIKKRLARAGAGKRGGYRTIIVYCARKRAVFVYGFAKSVADNIDDRELREYRKLAQFYLGLSDADLATALRRDELKEVGYLPKKTKKYRSEALAALHETAEGLHRIGLMDAKTMRDFDASCLTAVKELSARQIARLRKRAGVSQAVFANYLNVTTGLISQWERGEKHPQGTSLKLLTLIDKKGLEAIA